MQTDKPRQISVLLEYESGVMEVFFAMTEIDGDVALRPVGSVSRSGGLRATDPAALTEAIRLVGWTQRHLDVFEGRVVAD